MSFEFRTAAKFWPLKKVANLQIFYEIFDPQILPLTTLSFHKNVFKHLTDEKTCQTYLLQILQIFDAAIASLNLL